LKRRFPVAFAALASLGAVSSPALADCKAADAFCRKAAETCKDVATCKKYCDEGYDTCRRNENANAHTYQSPQRTYSENMESFIKARSSVRCNNADAYCRKAAVKCKDVATCNRYCDEGYRICAGDDYKSKHTYSKP